MFPLFPVYPTNKYVQRIAYLNEKLRNVQIQQETCKDDVIDTDTSRKLRVIDWGCLGSFCLGRTESFVKIIRKQNPDIVFLHGIDQIILFQLKKFFPRFKFIAEKMKANATKSSIYRCYSNYSYHDLRVTMLNESVSYESHKIINPPPGEPDEHFDDYELYLHSTILIDVKAHFGRMKLKLLNTQLNVKGSKANYRQNILKAILEEVRNTDDNVNVIMGVGGYLGDKEIVDVGGLPGRTVDMWEACGKPKKCKFKFMLDDTRLSIASLSEENFTADWTRLDYLGRTDRIFLCPASTGKIAIPKSFRVICIMKISDLLHSIMIVDMVMKR